MKASPCRLSSRRDAMDMDAQAGPASLLGRRKPLRRRPRVWVWALAGLTLGVSALPTPLSSGLAAAAFDPVSALKARFVSVLGSGALGRADWSVLAVSLDTGDTLFARNAEQALAPASNLKVLTVAAALHHLGPDFTWRTLLLTDALLDDGVLQGDVVLYGTGDPGLADRLLESDDAAFDDLALQLRAAGVKRIEGRVVGDGSFFTGPTRHPSWDPRDLNDWFTAASPALGYAENVVQFRIEPGVTGDVPIVHMTPGHGGVPVQNEARTTAGRARAPLWLVRENPDEPVQVVGELQARSRDVYRSMTVQDPVLWSASAMAAALRRAGIEVRGGAAAAGEASTSLVSGRQVFGTASPRVLAAFQSPPLIETLKVVNQRSHNFYADMVLKTLGRVVAADGSFEGGARVVEAFAIEQVGIAPDEVAVVDGSGLSADNRASARALVQTVAWTLQGPWATAFEASLPTAGSRELNRRMWRTAAAGNLKAKTGTIAGVSALSGVVTTRDGERVAFSVVGNGLRSTWFAKRNVEDALGVALAEIRGRLPSDRISALAEDR